MIPKVFASTLDLGQEYGYGQIQNIGQATSSLVGPAFMIATVAVVIYFLIGATRFIFSGGDDTKIKAAREMITHAIIGFVLLMLTFLFTQFIFAYFHLGGFNIVKLFP